MTADTAAADTAELHALAARHGLRLEGPLTINELGLDYRIVISAVAGGTRWVLRIPRRADVSAKVDKEARALAMLRRHLPIAVPDWRIATTELVAYPLLEDSTAIILQPGSTTLSLGALVGLMTGPVSPILNAAIYNRTPSALLGRVLGATSAVMLSAAPAVTLAAGVLVELVGPGPGLVVSTALAGGVALLTLRLRFGPVAALDLPTADRPARAKGER